MMKRLANPDILFRVILVLFVLYGLGFIYTTSFVIRGERYFSLFDDGMISMRYAKNFADGYGLVWNPGGPAVEGYTNPLWVLLMSFWHLFPIALSKMSLVIQLNALALLAINLVFVRKLALAVSGGSNTVAMVAVILTGTYVPLNNWSLQGMEVAALAPIVTCAAWLAVRGMQTGKPSVWIYVLLGIGLLTRMDAAVILVAITVFLAVVDRQNRVVHIAYGIGSATVFGGAQTLFRLAYYHDILPNTYYLKLEGFPLVARVARGVYVLGWFVASMSLVVFLGTFIVAVFQRSKPILLLVFLFVAQVAYSVYVGGDAWEWWGGSNRYISIVMPLFMVLLAYSLYFVFTHRVWRRLVTNAEWVAALHAAIAFGLLLWAAIVNYGGVAVGLPEWGLAIGLWLVAGVVLSRRVKGDSGAREGSDSRLKRMLGMPAMIVILGMALLDLNSLYVPRGLQDLFLLREPIQVHNNSQMVERALLLRETLKPGGSYAVVWAGIIPYFAGGNALDLLGKNDTVIAHQAMHGNSVLPRPDFYFYPGHMKYDYAYSVGELKPDAIVQFWSLEQEPPDQPAGPVPWIARPFVEGNYTQADFGNLNPPFFFRNDSSRVRWDAVEELVKSTAGEKLQ